MTEQQFYLSRGKCPECGCTVIDKIGTVYKCFRCGKNSKNLSPFLKKAKPVGKLSTKYQQMLARQSIPVIFR